MYLISLESCDIDLSNGIWYMLLAILHPEIQHDQCKPTKHLNSFDTHCKCSGCCIGNPRRGACRRCIAFHECCTCGWSLETYRSLGTSPDNGTLCRCRGPRLGGPSRTCSD